MELKSGEGTVVVADRDRLCNMSFEQQQCCCDPKNGQQEIKCLIENTAKDQEIARLNRVVDAQRDQNIIQSVVAALKTTSTTPAQ